MVWRISSEYAVKGKALLNGVPGALDPADYPALLRDLISRATSPSPALSERRRGPPLAPVAGMDCLELLQDQHAEAKQLFERLEKAEASKAHQLWTELKTKLTMHEELEETHFYPELKKEKAAEEIVLEAYQEHHVMDVLIQEISGLKPDDEEFHPKITVLQENVEHHIEEEEGELFPKVRKFWDKAKRENVGRKMADMKERLTRQRRAA